jgi:hypothetical protein
MARRHGYTLRNPDGFDWFSFDCYGDFDNCDGHSIPAYLAHLKSTLLPGQHLFLVPDASSGPYNQWPDAATLIDRAYRYRDLAEAEPLVVALFPFLWRASEMGGAATMPELAETWRPIGRCISRTPAIDAAGYGCDDGNCIWMTGVNFRSETSVDVRAPGEPDVLATYAADDVVRYLDQTPQVLTLRLRSQDELARFETTGLEVWAVNASAGSWSSGVHVQRPPRDHSITGFIDGVVQVGDQAAVNGWTCAKTDPDAIEAHLYVGGPAERGGTLVAIGRADAPSEPEVAEACDVGPSNHRFTILLSAANLADHAGQPIFIHGISPFGLPNLTIVNSGAFTVPAAP